MKQGSADRFVRTAGGLYVAWPLDVPSFWGEWALVAVMRQKPKRARCSSYALQIVPNRVLLSHELQALRSRPLLFWGMKVQNAPWALVMCREALVAPMDLLAHYGQFDPKRGIGV